MNTQEHIHLEEQWGAHNYHPLPVVLNKGCGAQLWDVEGKRYLDFLAAYSAANQGHCHPRLLMVLTTQASKLTLTSRAFHHELLGGFCKKICVQFGYERFLPMNTGVEAVETGIKLARRWGYDVKKVPVDQGIIIVCEGNFHGRTLAAISISTSSDSRARFGPYTPGFEPIPYGDIHALEHALKNPHVVGFLFEPIQGEGGVVIPPTGYLAQAQSLCSKHRVLTIADEIQTGLGRTGKWLACEHEHIQPDIVLLGKALSGGILPVSGVLTSSEIMLTIRPGEHGSTYGGNPLACAVASEAIDVIQDEKLCERSQELGEYFRSTLQRKNPKIQIRGRGLMNAIDLGTLNLDAEQVCLRLMNEGLLAKATRKTILRLTPPLVITQEELDQGIAILGRVLN